METKLKDKLVGRSSGMMKNLGVLYQRVTKVAVKPCEADAVGLASYYTSVECEAQTVRFEGERSRSQAEAYKSVMRC